MKYLATITLAAALTFSINGYSQTKDLTKNQINAKKTNTTLSKEIKKQIVTVNHVFMEKIKIS